MYTLHAIEKVVHKSVQQRTIGMMTKQSKKVAQTCENLSIVLMSTKNLNVPRVMVAGVNCSFDYVHAEHFLHVLFAGALWCAMLLECDADAMLFVPSRLPQPSNVGVMVAPSSVRHGHTVIISCFVQFDEVTCVSLLCVVIPTLHIML